MKRFEEKIVRNKGWREVLADWVMIGKFLVVLAGVMVFLLVLARCFPVRMKAVVVTKISFVAQCGQEEAVSVIPAGIGNKSNLLEYKKTEMTDFPAVVEIAPDGEALVMSVEELLFVPTEEPILEMEEVGTKYSSFSLTTEEIAILERIVEAEATGGSIDSKIHVAHVILNRCLSDGFPNDVESVVFEKKQFAPIKDGRYYTVKITDSTKEAVQMALAMDDTVDGAVYFALLKDVKNAKTRSWFDTLEFIFMDDLEHSFFRE